MKTKKLSYKAAAKFASSLTVTQLKIVVVAYAQGVSFQDVYAELQKIETKPASAVR